VRVEVDAGRPEGPEAAQSRDAGGVIEPCDPRKPALEGAIEGRKLLLVESDAVHKRCNL